MKNTITIKPKIQDSEKGARLDKFLSKEMPEITRSQIKKMILDGRILINEKETTVHHFLKNDDAITISEEVPEASAEQSPKPTREGNDYERYLSKIKIIEEHDDFIILEKPAGLLVHPTEKKEQNTLVDFLIAKYPELKQLGEDPTRPALVHRLDKDVSGLMLIPRNLDAFDYFKEQFKLRTLTKKYTALVYSSVDRNEGEIDFPIGRSKTKPGLFAAHPPKHEESYDAKDRKALTLYSITERFKNFTLLEVQIMTGRTHQIRVHMIAFSHPIVGDKLYFNKNLKTKKELDRIFLHAHYLKFKNIDGKEHEFESKLPKKLSDYLTSLKKV